MTEPWHHEPVFRIWAKCVRDLRSGPFRVTGSISNENEWMKEQNLTTYADVESVWIDGMIERVQDLGYNYIVWEEVFRKV